MSTAFERLSTVPAVLQPGAVPSPTSLAARALAAPPDLTLSGAPRLEQSVAASAPMHPPALKRRGVMGAPPMVDNETWYGQHTKLVHRLLHMTVRAAALPSGPADDEVEQVLANVLQHAREIVAYELPTLLAKDGANTIPYERLATARAKVSALRLELRRTKAELAEALASQGKARPA